VLKAKISNVHKTETIRRIEIYVEGKDNLKILTLQPHHQVPCSCTRQIPV